ncbi:MAG: M17 family peptidase N-terminal domain-containing protein, partial [Bacteroidota bacterium]
MSDLHCLFLASDTPPDTWTERYGPAVVRAAEDAATRHAPTLAYSADGSRLGVVPVPDGQTGAERWRWAAAEAARLATSLKTEAVTLQAPEADAAHPLAEGFALGAYRFDRYRTGDAPPPAPVAQVHLPDGTEADTSSAVARAEATNAARDLVNLSPDEKMPADLADAMREGAEAAGLRVEVWDKARIEDEGLGGLLAVNRGSVDPPRFVVIEHAPDGTEADRPVVLVGKAVTYDTGGLSLKPTKNSMDKMKADMGGGAAVYGAMLGLASLRTPLRVIALIPMSDNRPGVRA